MAHKSWNARMIQTREDASKIKADEELLLHPGKFRFHVEEVIYIMGEVVFKGRPTSIDHEYNVLAGTTLLWGSRGMARDYNSYINGPYIKKKSHD